MVEGLGCWQGVAGVVFGCESVAKVIWERLKCCYGVARVSLFFEC